MPNESPANPSGTADPAASPLASQLSPAERSRLSQCFQRGTQNAATNVDYAIEMFSACVLGDPGNAVYLQNLLAVLKRKHGSKKSGGLGAFWPGSKSLTGWPRTGWMMAARISTPRRLPSSASIPATRRRT